MKLEIINSQRVLTPSLGMWLYNEKHRVISDKIYLGKEANEEDWVEISTKEKEELEELWFKEAEEVV